MKTLSDLFNISYGHGLELNALVTHGNGINFVSRTAKNNGVAARVVPLASLKPIPAGTISVAVSGSIMEAFLQPEPFYSAYHVLCLTPKIKMTDSQKLFYCACIRANKYRYSYGRQANRTLKDIKVPSISDIPNWINDVEVELKSSLVKAKIEGSAAYLSNPKDWKEFTIGEIFDLKKGKRLTKADQRPGLTPFVGAIDKNNGLTSFIESSAIHEANTLTVVYNGNGVAETFYQPYSFWASDDVNVLYPRFTLNEFIAMFIAAIIRREKHKFSYGRKWHLERMKMSKIKLPVDQTGSPDWDYMERYIKTLPFSSQLETNLPKQHCETEESRLAVSSS